MEWSEVTAVDLQPSESFDPTKLNLRALWQHFGTVVKKFRCLKDGTLRFIPRMESKHKTS